MIVSKIIVAYFRGLKSPKKFISWLLKVIVALIVFPFFVLCIFVGHLSLVFGLGYKDDPLGYTIWLKK